MASNAHDIQVFLWKILELLSETCVTYSLRHPFLSISILCLFLMYMAFPLVFWVLVYTFPLVVCTSIILSPSLDIGIGKRRGKEEAEVENEEATTLATPLDPVDREKPFARVLSVRRRRAKEFRREDNHKKTERKAKEENAVSSTNFGNYVVDKNALIEENSPREIREVEVVVDRSLVNGTKISSCSPSESSKRKFDESGCQCSEDENNTNNNSKVAVQGNEEDDYQKNKTDVVIADGERNKRLEKLIARRRSRKLLSVEVRRTLKNMDRNDHHHISSIVIHNNNNNNANRLIIPNDSSVVGGGPISPSPGSAPSVLIPMRNPFDLPYDPQEEKPDLTGDSFDQEFMSVNTRDTMFCRHESFSLGALLPGELDRNRKEISSSVPDSRFKLKNSALEQQFSTKTAGYDFDEFTSTTEQESYEPSESTPNSRNAHDEHIKEIIQVHENGCAEDDGIETGPTPEEEQHAPRSQTSSEEEAPILLVDREAILKSLSSMARKKSVQEEIESINNEQIEEHFNRHRLYCADRATRGHAASYSIASDLQVEVSEVSSPPLTIDENLSYLDYDEDNRSTYDEESWLCSSSFDQSQLDEKYCAHPWCAIAEFPDSCQTNRATNLDEKIDKTLQRSVSLVGYTSSPKNPNKPEECSHEYKELNNLDDLSGGSKILLDNNTNQIEEPATKGQFEEFDHDGRDMEHSAADTTNHSDDSEERIEAEHLEIIMASAIVEDQIDHESTRHGEGEQSSFDEASTARRVALGSSNVHDGPYNLTPHLAVEPVQSSLPSPKSVLHPTCSVASFDYYVNDEIHQFNAHAAQVLSPVAQRNSTALTEHSAAALPDGEGEEVGVVEEESSAPSKTCTREDDEGGSSNQGTTNENGLKSESSRIQSTREAPSEPSTETSFASDDGVSSKKVITISSQSTDHDSDESRSPLFTEEEFSNRHKIITGEATLDDSEKSRNNDGRTEDSALRANKGHGHSLNYHDDQESRANPTLYRLNEAICEVPYANADETPTFELSEPVEDNCKYETYTKNEQEEQHHTSHESMSEDNPRFE